MAEEKKRQTSLGTPLGADSGALVTGILGLYYRIKLGTAQ